MDQLMNLVGLLLIQYQLYHIQRDETKNKKKIKRLLFKIISDSSDVVLIHTMKVSFKCHS